MGDAIYANHTVTFIGVKQGLVTARARDHVGELHFCGLGVNVEFDSIEEESALGIDHQVIPRLYLDKNQPFIKAITANCFVSEAISGCRVRFASARRQQYAVVLG